MSKMVALIFDHLYSAEEARAALRRMDAEGLLKAGEMALVVKGSDGKTRLSQDLDEFKDERFRPVAELVAAVTGTTPFVMIGAPGRPQLGRLADRAVARAFIHKLQAELLSGASCLILLACSDPTSREKIVGCVGVWGPRILESDFPA
jgi:uncharacterized membrane protein